MARIPLVAPRDAGLLGRLAYRYARRRFGDVPEPFAALRHHPGLFWSSAVAESLVERAATVLPARLRDLAVYRTATRVGCSWCVDFGEMLWIRRGLDADHLRRAAADDAPDDPGFDADERAVLAYADAVTAQPPTVGDAQVADLDARLGHAGLVELTHLVALENQRARFNAALGLHAQGFAASCAVPSRG
ncbi:carboxymuconolactone decarboxylase family protein [Actinomycetospora cinnamomea]|uniref:Alkylhydroperoxidase family enzyme n=1 Tax=Actinomycetospora cinnamomea TaxID=663609 RepID=A0A2U1FIR8_9PSEU|nr:carboxymuconolactone decarboxylase family protein [Actinomycetospora cinnamomea]PVZ12085.1 alkylhydroperoxidase family enzyme [Actinomycetospora cinnamomea]